MKKMSFLMLLIGLTVFSCSKDEELTNTELLTQTEWNLVSSTLSVNGVINPDASLETCDLDDIYDFKTGGTYTQDPNMNMCDTDDMLYSGTWAFANDETEFIVDGDDSNKIDELTESTFRLSFEETDEEGDIYKFESTFNAK